MIAEINLQTRAVKRVVNGAGKGHCLPVIDNSIYPTGPDIFKGQPTYSYVINVAQWLDDAEDKAGWTFADTDYVEQVAVQGMLSVEQCKTILYQMQKEERQKLQLGEFLLGEMTVVLKDREDSLIISSLPEADTRYKLGQGQWITLLAAQVTALKEAHRLHVQAAYDWEMNANADVDALTTLDELTSYVNN
tara:strand:- start:77 stop:649 length:573 start_codon:yes stop_codon:yes gene_type:complete